MNEHADFDRALRTWFDDGPSTMPDRVVDVVADRIGRQPQRRPWRLLRRSTMPASFKLIAAAAAVLVLAVVGYNLLPKGPQIGPNPSATTIPSPTVAPSAAAAPTERPPICDDGTATCAGLLPEGTNSSVAFQPQLSFTVQRGWTNTLDTARTYTIHYNFTRGHHMQVLSQVAIPEQNASCTRVLKAGVGNTVADWVEFLTTHPGLETTTPEAISLGGYDGMQLDLHVAADWTETCPNSIGPAVVLMTQSGPPAVVRKIDDQQVTVRIIHVEGETVIVYLESSPDADELAALNQEFDPFFDSFQFTPAG